MNKTLALVGMSLTVALLGSMASAAVVVEETFNYGGSDIALATDTTTLNGGAGLAGSWALSPTNVNNRGSYIATGLTFGNLEVTGGAMQTEGWWSGSSTVKRQLNITASGTVYGAFLYRSGDPVSPSTSSLMYLETSSTNPSSTWGSDAAVTMIRSDETTQLSVGYQTGVQTVTMTGDNIVASTASPVTYMSLYKITNVAGSGDKVMTAWTLTETQFNYFSQFVGSGLESALTSASVGTGSTDVYQYGTVTTSVSVTIDPTRNIMLFTRENPSTGTVWPAVFDEIRLSDTSLDEVVPVPEPATLSLLGLGALALIRKKR